MAAVITATNHFALFAEVQLTYSGKLTDRVRVRVRV